jgi:hypothetical protein
VAFVSVNKARELAAARPTDDFARAFQSATLQAARRMRELFTLETLQRAIATRQPWHLLNDSRWRGIEHELQSTLEDAIRAKVAEAGEAELRRLEGAPSLHPAGTRLPVYVKSPEVVVIHLSKELSGRFDLRNPFSEDFVRRRGADARARHHRARAPADPRRDRAGLRRGRPGAHDSRDHPRHAGPRRSALARGAEQHQRDERGRRHARRDRQRGAPRTRIGC